MSCLKKETLCPSAKARDKSSGMASKKTSFIQENRESDECRENIPPGVAAVTGTPKLKVQTGDVVGYSSVQQSGENEPFPDTCTFSTPAPTNSNVKAKPRLSGFQSALTPILKNLNIVNKCSSPETLMCGNNSHPTAPSLSFGKTMINCQKSTGDSSRHSKADIPSSPSGRSLGDPNSPMCWLADECLPEVTFLDVTCDTTMQLSKNDFPLPDTVPSTPITTFITSQPSTNLNTILQTCPQNQSLDLMQSNVRSSQVESEVTDRARAHAKNTPETSRRANQSITAAKAGGSCGVQDVMFDRCSLQKSSFLEKAGASSSLQNVTLGTNSPFKHNGTSLRDHHQTSEDKSSPNICNAKERHFQVKPAKMSQYSGITTVKDTNTKMVDIPESIDAPLRWLDDRYFPEITLLDVTRDSEVSSRDEVSSLEVTQDIPSVDGLQNSKSSSVLSGQIQSEDLSSTLDGNVTHTISSVSEQSDKYVGENTPKASLEVTQDISMGSVEDSQPSLEHSGQNTVTTEKSIKEDSQGTHPSNVTHDLNYSSDMSVHCAAPQSSASDTQCNTSSKNVSSDLHGVPVEASNNGDANNEEPLINHDAEMISKASQPSPKRAGSANSTFTIGMQSNLSSSTNVNATAKMSCPQNKTLDLPQSNVNIPKAESDIKDQTTTGSKNISETSTVITQTCSFAKPGGSCDAQNITFDRHSLQKSTGSTILGEAGAITINLQNNTFNVRSPSKQNGMMTISKSSSTDTLHNTMDQPSTSKVCNSMSTAKDKNTEVEPSEVCKGVETTASLGSDAKMVNKPGSLEPDPAVEVASGAAQWETKDHSHSGLPHRDGLSDTLDHQSIHSGENKSSMFNLDDTLDLRSDFLITSTPMITCKMFNFNTERDEGKAIVAQKIPYGDGPNKPDNQLMSDVPSNIISDRKTLIQAAARSLLPPLKAASQLLKYKPAYVLPGRAAPLLSDLPVLRQRTQAEALRKTAASNASQVVGF